MKKKPTKGRILAQMKLYKSSINHLDFSGIEIIFSNKGLWPWEGGCLWEEKGKKPVIQLRTILKKKNNYLGIYSREEILIHEWVHAQRLGYKEPIFEEILAYQTSKFFWRRYFGPLFRNQKEALLLLGMSFLGYVTLVPFFLTLFFYLLRLWKYQKIFFVAKKKYISQWGSFEKAFPHLVKLTDQEIIKIGKKIKIN